MQYSASEHANMMPSHAIFYMCTPSSPCVGEVTWSEEADVFMVLSDSLGQ